MEIDMSRNSIICIRIAFSECVLTLVAPFRLFVSKNFSNVVCLGLGVQCIHRQHKQNLTFCAQSEKLC